MLVQKHGHASVCFFNRDVCVEINGCDICSAVFLAGVPVMLGGAQGKQFLCHYSHYPGVIITDVSESA